MESFSIMALADEVSIMRKKEYRYINGSSNVPYKDFELELKKMSNVRKDGYIWLLDGYLEIIGYNFNGFFQGIELKGCLSYLNGGIDLCFEFIKIINNKITPLKIYILNQEVEIESSNQLCEFTKHMYNDKITIFQKQYGNVQLKVTCGEFYKEMKKRSKWYYKMLHHNK